MTPYGTWMHRGVIQTRWWLYVEVEAKSLRPGELVLWRGYTGVCERQARRSTFIRLTGDWEGCRIQLKHRHKVTKQVAA